MYACFCQHYVISCYIRQNHFYRPITQELYMQLYVIYVTKVNHLSSSGVVEGNAGGTLFPQIFHWRNAVPPPSIRTWGNTDTVAFPK